MFEDNEDDDEGVHLLPVNTFRYDWFDVEDDDGIVGGGW